MNIDIKQSIGEPWAKSQLKMSPSLRKDFVNRATVRISGLYEMGRGYVSQEAVNRFETAVHSFCHAFDFQYSMSEYGGQISDNKDSYMYFMGMECEFQTTAESKYSALQLATLFQGVISNVEGVTQVVIR